MTARTSGMIDQSYGAAASRKCLPLRGRPGGILVSRKHAAAPELPAHGAVPGVTRRRTADRHHDDANAIERPDRPQHPSRPQNREQGGAEFQLGFGVHGGSPE